MNSLIELHDSKLAAVSTIDGQIIVFFAPAYVHESEGRPGWDQGRGYVQAAALTFAQGSVKSDAAEWIGDVWQGDLEVDGHVFTNQIPIPFHHAGAVTLRLHIFETGTKLTIQGHGATLKLIGEAVYVEEFPGAVSESPATTSSIEASGQSLKF